MPPKRGITNMAAGRAIRRVWLAEHLEKLSDRDIADGLFGALYAEMDVTGLAGELVDQAVKRLRRACGGAIAEATESTESTEKSECSSVSSVSSVADPLVEME